MDLDELRTFVEAVKRGSFSKAARALSLSQPAVSRRIRNLEREVGASLFDRSGQAITPTRRGLEFLTFAEKTLTAWEELKPALAQEAIIRGPLRISASTAPGEQLVPDLLARFLETFPEIDVSLHIMDSQAVEECVEAGHCDVGFMGRPPRRRTLERRPVAEDHIVLAVPCDHPLASYSQIPLHALHGVHFVTRTPGSGTRETVERILTASGHSLPKHRTALVVNSVQAQLAAIAEGHGVGFVSELALRFTSSDRLVGLPIKGIDLRRSLFLIADPDKIRENQDKPLGVFWSFFDTHSMTSIEASL